MMEWTWIALDYLKLFCAGALGLSLGFLAGIVFETWNRNNNLLMDLDHRTTKIRGRWYRLEEIPEPPSHDNVAPFDRGGDKPGPYPY